MAGFRKVATVDEIPVGTMKGFQVGHERIVVARLDDGFFAVADECSHDSAPISGGSIKDHEIICPRHGARFDLKTGAVTAPPAIVPIDTMEVKVEGGDVLVMIDD